MRKVLSNNDEVAHFWANKVQSEGKGSNFFFENNIIYSYGYHFPIAKHYSVKGKDFILKTTQSYSVTTSQHAALVNRASSHLKSFSVYNVEPNCKQDHLDNVKDRIDFIGDLMLKANRSRKYKDLHLEHALSIAQEMKEYCSIYLPRHKFDFDLEGIEKQKAEVEKKEKAIRKREEKAKLKKYIDYFTDWKNDNTMQRQYFSLSDSPIFLRVKGDLVETSHGASVPVHQAKLFFTLCKACKSSGKEKTNFDHRVGHYSPTKIDSKGNAVIGCHKLKFEEMQSIEHLLN